VPSWSTRHPISGPCGRAGSVACQSRSAMRALILPVFGDSRLGDVLPIAVQQSEAELASSRYAPATIRQASARLAGGATLMRDPGRYPDGTC